MPGADALRVQVRLSRLTHPELHAALQGLPPRRRADRVRQLALLGLRSLYPSHLKFRRRSLAQAYEIV